MSPRGPGAGLDARREEARPGNGKGALSPVRAPKWKTNIGYVLAGFFGGVWWGISRPRQESNTRAKRKKHGALLPNQGSTAGKTGMFRAIPA